MIVLPGDPRQPRVAVISDKQLGDVMLLEPMARLLAERSGAPVAMHVNPALRPLVELMPSACWAAKPGHVYEESWTTSWRSRAVLSTWRFPARHRKLLVNQKKHLRWWYRLLFNEMVKVPSPGEYWASYFWRAVGGDPVQFTPPRLDQAPPEWRHPDLPQRPFILINPTAAWPSKFWEAESWARVREALVPDREDIPWVMTGGGSEPERAHCARIAAAAGGRFVDLSGRTSLREYLHALCSARLVLCVDGSASHLAQAWNVPAVTLFGPVYPKRWHLPTPRHRAISAFDQVKDRTRTCADVSPELFLKTCESLLAEQPGILD